MFPILQQQSRMSWPNLQESASPDQLILDLYESSGKATLVQPEKFQAL